MVSRLELVAGMNTRACAARQRSVGGHQTRGGSPRRRGFDKRANAPLLMEKSTPLGLVAGIVLIFGTILTGDGWITFFDPMSLGIVLGGTIAGLFVTFTVAEFKNLIPLLKGFFGFQVPDYSALAAQIVDFSRTFRGERADVTLAPTRALARARKTLSAMPAGGGTPLAAGIDQALELVRAIRRQGRTPKVVFLTDGRANVARDAAAGSQQAKQDAVSAARSFRVEGVNPVLIDTSKRPRAAARELADAMDATYLPMPYADSAGIRSIVGRTGAS